LGFNPLRLELSLKFRSFRFASFENGFRLHFCCFVHDVILSWVAVSRNRKASGRADASAVACAFKIAECTPKPKLSGYLSRTNLPCQFGFQMRWKTSTPRTLRPETKALPLATIVVGLTKRPDQLVVTLQSDVQFLEV
jgi:hypothetical protein